MVITQMLTRTFPAVRKQLAEYKSNLRGCDSPLARQGLASIRDKEFHCLGGSVYALLAGGKVRRDLLRFIVAFQTISDYLDNLCDRFGIQSERAFRQLHLAMLDSLELEGNDGGHYYRFFPNKEDGGYLLRLVGDCRASLGQLSISSPGRDYIFQLVRLYIDLQSFKHLERSEGETKLRTHLARHQHLAPGLYWWEFAAACGSTLGVFSLLSSGQESAQVFEAYLPWVQGLHILLDYYIDQAEDLEYGDMNLIAYHDENQQVERLLWFYRQAKEAVKSLPNSKFHALIIEGLLGLYLSDTKAWAPERAGTSRKILEGAGLRARVLERMGRGLRKLGAV